MTAVLTLLTVIGMSLLITRIATVSLVSTGLSKESARFQARSALSGTGFTTGEAEAVVGHPVRRRIIMFLMLVGNAGIVTVISTLILSFVDTQGPADWGERLGVLAVGLLILWYLALSRLVERALDRAIRWALRRWTHIDVSDYAGLLHLAGDYRVMEMHVDPDDWVAEQALEDLRLAEEGILVLGIERPGAGFLGAPRGRAHLQAGDTLILYGRGEALTDLDQRPAGTTGDLAHHRATVEQGAVERKEEKALGEGAEGGEGDGDGPGNAGPG